MPITLPLQYDASRLLLQQRYRGFQHPSWSWVEIPDHEVIPTVDEFLARCEGVGGATRLLLARAKGSSAAKQNEHIKHFV